MNYHKAKNTAISKISAMLLALALCMSLVMPMAGMDVYADAEGSPIVTEESANDVAAEESNADAVSEESTPNADAEESQSEADVEEGTTDAAAVEGTKDASESEDKAEAVPAVTAITNCETYYNKRYSQELKIEADITPAGGRDVELQRYNSEEDSWETILTETVGVSAEAEAEAAAEQGNSESPDADTEATAEQDDNESPDADTEAVTNADSEQDESESPDAGTDTAAEQDDNADSDAEAVTEQVENSAADENTEVASEQPESSDVDAETDTEAEAAQDESESASTDENASGTSDAASTAPETKEEEPEDTHVTFSVPKEERQKATSIWRIYVPATENASEATSDKITVITRNLEDIGITARAACIYRIDGDGKGTIIYSRNSFNQVAQASTTKLMTAVLLVESGLMDSTTKVSPHAAATPYASGHMAVGDVFNTKDLLYAMLLPSSNDAATAVAERVGGSEAAFVNMMNAKAEKMGLTSTHFRNPHGLDADGHYTTAKELAKLTAYAYTIPEIRDCWATQFKTIKSLEYGRRWNLWSTNAIFGYVSNFLGGKTGTESNAGCCFTGVYTFNGGTYVTVVLGSGYGFSRWSDTKKLHKYIQDYALSRY